MKRTNLLYIFSVSAILWFVVGTNEITAQETRIMPKQRTSPERAAEGQTRWMMNSLKLDRELYDIIYRINLKYQTIADSIHLTNALITTKQEAYINCTWSRNKELKKVLPADAFDKFISITEAVKEKAAAYRTSVQK